MVNLGKAEIIEDLEALSVMRKAYLPKNIRYYMSKFVTILFPKKRSKSFLKRFQ